MYKFKQNPVLENEISIYKDNKLVASINKANFENDFDAFDFADFLVSSLNYISNE